MTRLVSRCRTMPGHLGLGAFSTKTGNFPRVRPSLHLREAGEPIEDDALYSSVSQLGDGQLQCVMDGWLVKAVELTKMAVLQGQAGWLDQIRQTDVKSSQEVR
jgi:hypothetical protein